MVNTQPEHLVWVLTVGGKMHLFDQRILGIIILVLLGALVAAKRIATGSILDKPKGSFLIQLVNSFNLFFLLLVNPLAALLLITRQTEMINPTPIIINSSRLVSFLETAGLMIYVTGYLLMAWALIQLGSKYQIGGSVPRLNDHMEINGPYHWIRHPMYTAALNISLGLACLTQSWVFLGIFLSYLVLILSLIPLEEEGLQQAYKKQYDDYRRKTRELIPYVY
jgi:protein-S-isoprenylcysteine O-methyltransferase Ste14